MTARFVALVAGILCFFLAVFTQGILTLIEPSARTADVTAWSAPILASSNGWRPWPPTTRRCKNAGGACISARVAGTAIPSTFVR